MKYVSILFLGLLFASCAIKAPVQEMAEARSAVQTAQEMNAKKKPSRYLQSAEQALQQASDALDVKNYNLARVKAAEARRNAQQAVHILQKKLK